MRNTERNTSRFRWHLGDINSYIQVGGDSDIVAPFVIDIVAGLALRPLNAKFYSEISISRLKKERCCHKE
jgi:hypothetical protein